MFSVLEDKGPASLMLLLEPDLTPKLKSFWASVDVGQYGHWLQESADLGITAIDSQVLIQVGKMTLLTLYKVYRAGEISRNQAVSRVSYVICSLINTLRAKPCN